MRWQTSKLAPFVAVLLMGSSPARAQQTIEDAVRQHAQEHLRPKQRKPKPKQNDSKAREPAKPPPRASRQSPRISPPPKAKKEEKSPYPIRVIGRNLELDPKVGVAYRGWRAEQYPTVAVSNQGFFTWSLSLQARFFRAVRLERGYYESNALSPPRHEGAVIASQAGRIVPKTARLLGALGFPVQYLIEPLIRYETRAHQTTATPRSPVRVIPREAHSSQPNTDFPLTQEPLRMVSAFETFVVAAKFNPGYYEGTNSPAAKIPPIHFGYGVIQYRKPYQFNVGDAVLDEFLFDARFRGVGIALGVDTPEQPERFYVDLSTITGIGEVRLLSNLTLNEVVADDTYIGFFQGNLTVGYLHPLLRTRPTLMVGANASFGGATFFFFKTKYQENERIEVPPLNWDILWGAQAYVSLPL